MEKYNVGDVVHVVEPASESEQAYYGRSAGGDSYRATVQEVIKSGDLFYKLSMGPFAPVPIVNGRKDLTPARWIQKKLGGKRKTRSRKTRRKTRRRH